MLISSQRIANGASTKHPEVNEVSSDALPDKASRRRPKGRCDGKLHTHLCRKHQKKEAVDDEIELRRQGNGERQKRLSSAVLVGAVMVGGLECW
jgi:hypothetical protein